MKHLVTGGSGFLGNLLAKRLHERGEQVRIMDTWKNSAHPEGIGFIECNILDRKTLSTAMKDVDIVHHAAAKVPLAQKESNFWETNVTGTKNTLDAAAERGVRKFVYISSSAVFGKPGSNPLTENTVPEPDEIYGKSKHEGEKVCYEYADKGMDVTIIRPRTILGPERLGIFQILFEWVFQGGNIPVLGKGDNVYQFVHAEDLIGACIAAAFRTGTSVYNIGTDRFGTMREALQSLCDHAKTGSKVVSVPVNLAIWGMKLTSFLGISPLADYHILMYGESFYFDTSKAQKELSWKPRFSNGEMFTESYDWYLKNRGAVVKSGEASQHRFAVKQGALKIVQRCLSIL